MKLFSFRDSILGGGPLSKKEGNGHGLLEKAMRK